MSDLITPTSPPPLLAPRFTLLSHLQLRQRQTWLRLWRWRAGWVREWGSVMEEIPCLIFTCLLNWTLLKDELCSRTTSCLRDWRPSSLTHNRQPGSAGVGSLIKPGGGLLLIIAGPDFSCDDKPWLQLWSYFVKKDTKRAYFLKKNSGYLNLLVVFFKPF